MTLLERIQARLCHEPGCRREPRYPDLAFCDEHRVRWLPGRRLKARDETGYGRAA